MIIFYGISICRVVECLEFSLLFCRPETYTGHQLYFMRLELDLPANVLTIGVSFCCIFFPSFFFVSSSVCFYRHCVKWLVFYYTKTIQVVTVHHFIPVKCLYPFSVLESVGQLCLSFHSCDFGYFIFLYPK